MGEKLKYMGWGAGICIIMQLFYILLLQETKMITWDKSQIIGKFFMEHFVIAWGFAACGFGITICGAILAWPAVCWLARRITGRSMLITLSLTGLMFFVLASMPNKAMAEEANDGWITVWAAQADTLVGKGVVTMVNIDDEDLPPIMVKVAVKELATGIKHEIAVPRDGKMSAAAVGDTVTVLRRYAQEQKKTADGIMTHANLISRYEITVAKKK